MNFFKNLFNSLFNSSKEVKIIKETVKGNYENISELMAAAKQGNADAQNRLGNCYAVGEDVEESQEKAVEWWLKAAKQGVASAQCNVASYLCAAANHAKSAEEKNRVLKEAAEFYKASAEQGNMYAQFYLGGCYHDGAGIRQSHEKAIEWYRKSAEQGYEPAQFKLGMCHYLGHGTKQSYEKAAEWFKKAAKRVMWMHRKESVSAIITAEV